MKKKEINYLKKRINIYDNYFEIYKLLNWIDIDKLDFEILSENSNAIHLIEKNLNKIKLEWLIKNINASGFFDIIMHYYRYIDINSDDYEDNDYFDYFREFSRNPNSIYLLEKNPNKIYWRYLSENPNAIHLLEQNLDKIDWRYLSENPNAIHLLEQNLDKIDWDALSCNPNAIHLLEKNIDKINWYCLSQNKSIFRIDYNFLRNRMKNTIAEELMMNRFNPINIDKFEGWGFN